MSMRKIAIIYPLKEIRRRYPGALSLKYLMGVISIAGLPVGQLAICFACELSASWPGPCGPAAGRIFRQTS
jgi:hypothetical protein